MKYYLCSIRIGGPFLTSRVVDIWKDVENSVNVEHFLSVSRTHRYTRPHGKIPLRSIGKNIVAESDDVEELIEYAVMEML